MKYLWHTFPALNKPIKSWRPWKKYAVLVKNGDSLKVVHFGATWYSDFLKHKDPKRRANFKARHNCDTAKDNTTPRKWACNYNR